MKKVLLGAVCLAFVSLLALESGAEVIWKKWDRGSEFSQYGIYGGYGAKTQFGVWPVASGHSGGVVYSNTGWAYVYWSDAVWCWFEQGGYGNTDEVWVAGMYPHYTSQYGWGNNTMSYAVYVDAGGNRYWDNNGGNNYSVNMQGYNLPGDPSTLHNCYTW